MGLACMGVGLGFVWEGVSMWGLVCGVSMYGSGVWVSLCGRGLACGVSMYGSGVRVRVGGG